MQLRSVFQSKGIDCLLARQKNNSAVLFHYHAGRNPIPAHAYELFQAGNHNNAQLL